MAIDDLELAMDYTIKLALIFWDGGSSKNLFRFAILIFFLFI